MARKNGLFSLAVVVSLACTSILHADEKRPTVTYSIGIKGMTCARCSASARKELAAVPGVVKASVDHKAGHAWVTVQAPRQPTGTVKPRRIGAELAEAVKRAGAHHGDGFTPTVHYVLTIQGMTCEDCARHITTALRKLPGVAGASVSYKGGYAVVVPSAKAGQISGALTTAVEKTGYRGVVHSGP